MKQTIVYIIVIAICTLFLCFIGIYNGFLLVTSDSGAYIYDAFNYHVPRDRTVFYSQFIRFASLKTTLWYVFIVQSFLLSFLLNRILSIAFNFKYVFHLGIILLTVLLSSVSWYTSQLMPDIFTSILFLASIVFLLTKNNTERIVMLPLILLSIIIHNSHLITSLLFYAALCILFFYYKKHRIYFRKSCYLLIISMVSWLTVSFSNYKVGNGFTPSTTVHIFLMGKLVENGILKKYLSEHCVDNRYKLCGYKDSLPKHAWDFIWQAKSPFLKTGGWDSSRTEYRSILKASITEPKYLLLNVLESAKATCRQIVLTDIGNGLWPYEDGTNPFWKVQELFPEDLPAFKKSIQNTIEFKFSQWNLVYKLSLPIVFITSLFFVVKSKSHRIIFLYGSLIFFLFLNAFATATFANVLDRLNSRAIWLLFFVSLAVITNQALLYLPKSKQNRNAESEKEVLENS